MVHTFSRTNVEHGEKETEKVEDDRTISQLLIDDADEGRICRVQLILLRSLRCWTSESETRLRERREKGLPIS